MCINTHTHTHTHTHTCTSILSLPLSLSQKKRDHNHQCASLAQGVCFLCLPPLLFAPASLSRRRWLPPYFALVPGLSRFLCLIIIAGGNGEHDGSKCSDNANDCCAHEDWSEPKTCRDGYVAIPKLPAEAPWCVCPDYDGGSACYGCYPPGTQGSVACVCLPCAVVRKCKSRIRKYYLCMYIHM